MRRFAFQDSATPQEAKACWESMENPNYSSVARSLTQAGRPSTADAVRRWKANGWQFKSGRPTRARTYDEFATRSLDVNLPAITGDPTTRLSELLTVLKAGDNAEKKLTVFQEGLAPLATGIVGLKDAELLSEAHRTILQAAMMAGQLLLRSPNEFTANPEAMGNLLKSTAYCVEAVSNSLLRLHGAGQDKEKIDDPADKKPNGHATVYPPGEDPLDGAFRSWRNIPTASKPAAK